MAGMTSKQIAEEQREEINDWIVSIDQIVEEVFESNPPIVSGLVKKVMQSFPTFASFNILLIGETGSGKSTLINYLANYFNGGSFEDLKIAVPTRYYKATEEYQSSEKDLHDPTQSKTNECTTYCFTKDNYRYNFIDTPGLSDTEGTERYDQHISEIINAAKETGSLESVIIVINGTVERATDNLRDTLVRFIISIPGSLLNQLIVVLTNCSRKSANFDLESLAQHKFWETNVFYMNNSALRKPRETWITNTIWKAVLFNHWQASMEEINKMIHRVKKLGTAGNDAFKEMLRKRDKIMSELTLILLEVKKLQDTQNKLNSAKDARKEVTENIQKYSDYKKNEEVEYVEMEKTSYHNTICMMHTEKVCHERCGLHYTANAGTGIFTGCACMHGRTNCQVCECEHTTHYHAMEKPVKKTKTVEKILHDMKILYDQNTNQEMLLKDDITKYGTDIELLENALKTKESKIRECCQELKQIFIVQDELNTVVEPMEANACTLTSIEASKMAVIMKKNIKRLAYELSNK